MAGRGRFGRVWYSEPGDSLTMSIAFTDYPDLPRPWLVGMAAACASALTVGCQVRWPNDLVFQGRKLGGVLTEIVLDSAGRRVPVVGIGVNVAQAVFAPELAPVATSCRLSGLGHGMDSPQLSRSILDALGSVPEPLEWTAISGIWEQIDATPGKRYRLADGREGAAVRVGPTGELVCDVGGAEVVVLAADALH